MRNFGDRKNPKNALCYKRNGASRATVRRQYAAWRETNNLVERCDSVECQFHTAELLWNGKLLPLILDHVNGNRHDNRPTNLRYLCPNCDAQLDTRGGKNKGRIQNQTDHGYYVIEKSGKRIYNNFPGADTLSLRGGAVHTESKNAQPRVQHGPSVAARPSAG